MFDDPDGDSGAISNGWSLALTMITPVNQLADLALSAVAAPNPVLAGGTLSYTFTITNNGPNTATSVAFTNVLPAGVTLVSASLSQGNIVTNATSVIGNLGTLAVATNATVTLIVRPTAAVIPQGTNTVSLTNSANVAANEADVNLGNNAVSVVSTVNRPVADLTLAQTVAPDPVYVGYYLTNAVALTNNGPETALSVVLTATVADRGRIHPEHFQFDRGRLRGFKRRGHLRPGRSRFQCHGERHHCFDELSPRPHDQFGLSQHRVV